MTAHKEIKARFTTNIVWSDGSIHAGCSHGACGKNTITGSRLLKRETTQEAYEEAKDLGLLYVHVRDRHPKLLKKLFEKKV